MCYGHLFVMSVGPFKTILCYWCDCCIEVSIPERESADGCYFRLWVLFIYEVFLTVNDMRVPSPPGKKTALIVLWTVICWY